MPITYSIDHARRLVLAKGSGVVTDEEVFSYQREVWSRPEVAGYDELFDMTAVERVVGQSAPRARELAHLSARMDADTPSKFAIVAPDRLAFGVGRMYEIYRELEAESTKRVGVFRKMADALRFLGLEATYPVSGESEDETVPGN
jgi:hypothetical protein